MSPGLGSIRPDGASIGLNYTGLIAINNQGEDAPVIMTKVGGGAFRLDGIDLANFLAGASQGSTITFTGNLRGGGTMSQSFTLGQGEGFRRFAFSGFSDVTSVNWGNPANFHVFDNIDVTPLSTSAVPGPWPPCPSP